MAEEIVDPNREVRILFISGTMGGNACWVSKQTAARMTRKGCAVVVPTEKERSAANDN